MKGVVFPKTGGAKRRRRVESLKKALLLKHFPLVLRFHKESSVGEKPVRTEFFQKITFFLGFAGNGQFGGLTTTFYEINSGFEPRRP
jgi:hypothetical protein